MYRNDLIRGKMAQMGKTIEVLKDEVKLSPDTIVKIRKGDTGVSVGNLQKIAAALEIPMSELFEIPSEQAEAAA